MPFVSEKQRAKFIQLVKEGKLSQEKFDEFAAETGDKKLPLKLDKKYTRQGTVRGVRKTR